ncbi:MAG: hypothetical protein FWC77_05080 [Defluviitaleaceae bacterium]|nr:hypothetical protein [Defluviitaleaceae bacterium]
MVTIIDILKKYDLWDKAQYEYRIQKAHSISEKIRIHIGLLRSKYNNLQSERRRLFLEDQEASKVYHDDLNELEDWLAQLRECMD